MPAAARALQTPRVIKGSVPAGCKVQTAQTCLPHGHGQCLGVQGL